MTYGNCNRDESRPNIKPKVRKASTALAVGDIVYEDANGFIDKAGAATAASAIVGVCMRNVKSTDSDYASNGIIEVDVFDKGNRGDTFRLAVGTGTPAQTHVGETHDLAAAGTADLTANAVNVYMVERILSSTEVLVSFK